MLLQTLESGLRKNIMPAVLFGIPLFSGCTYVKSLGFSYDIHEQPEQAIQKPPVYLMWVSLNRYTPKYWIPPLATVGWDKGDFRFEFSFAGDSIEAINPSFKVKEIWLYEAGSAFEKDTLVIFSGGNDLAITKAVYYRSVSFKSDYFLPIKKPKNLNLILKMNYSLTSRNGETEYYTLHAPLRKKNVSEFSILGLVIENKQKKSHNY